jgi:hypothetical protein
MAVADMLGGSANVMGSASKRLGMVEEVMAS